MVPHSFGFLGDLGYLPLLDFGGFGAGVKRPVTGVDSRFSVVIKRSVHSFEEPPSRRSGKVDGGRLWLTLSLIDRDGFNV